MFIYVTCAAGAETSNSRYLLYSPEGNSTTANPVHLSAENMRNPSIHVTLNVHTATKKYWYTKFYAQTSEDTPQYHKGKGAKQHNSSSTRKNVPCLSWEKILFPSPVVLEKGRCPNTVAKASLLPLVQARAKDGKYPLHESRRRLNQRYVLCYIVPERKLHPVVMPKSLKVVPGIRVRRRDVVYKHNHLLQAAGSAPFTLSERFMPCLAHLMHVIRRLTPIVAHICL